MMKNEMQALIRSQSEKHKIYKLFFLRKMGGKIMSDFFFEGGRRTPAVGREPCIPTEQLNRKMDEVMMMTLLTPV